MMFGREFIVPRREHFQGSPEDDKRASSEGFLRELCGSFAHSAVKGFKNFEDRKGCAKAEKNNCPESCSSFEDILLLGEIMISQESRRLAGILLVILPTVLYGGYFLLTQLMTPGSGYMDNPLRQNLFRAGHAHAGVLLVLSLVALRYVDEANLTEGWKRYVRSSIPSAAIFLPAAFFFSVLSPNATAPNGFIYLAYVGAVVLASGLLALGVGLLRTKS